MALRLITLGGLRGSTDGVDVDWLGSKWVLSAVLIHLTVERSATRDTLFAMFWPECDSDTAAHRLSQTIYALRRALGDGCLESKGREIRAGADLGADVLDFERAVEEARHRDAIELYGGPFLAGVHLVATTGFENWVDARRARCARAFRVSCRTLLDEHVAAGDLPGALAVARAWVAPDPVDDEAQHRLIELLALTGQRSQALREYAAYAKLLHADGLEPLDQTKELVAGLEHLRSTTEPGDVAPVAVPAPAAQPGGPADPEPPAVPAAGPGPAASAAAETAPAADVGAALRPADVGARPVVRTTQPAGTARRRWPWIAAAAAMSAVALWAAVSPGGSAAPPQSLGLGILLDNGSDAASDNGFGTAFEASLSGHLAEVTGLRVGPAGTIAALRAADWPLDSIASSLQVDYLVQTTVLRAGDTVAITLVLLEGGLRLVRAAHLREHVPTVLLADSLGRMAADSVRTILGDRIHERQLGQGTRDSIASRLFYSAQRRRLRAVAALRDGDPARARMYLDQADSLFGESHARDRDWVTPALQRAAQAEVRAIVMDASGDDPADIEAAIDTGVRRIDEVLERNPNHAAALAWRGRLRWLRADFAGPMSDAVVDSVVRDLEDALDRDAPAWAAVELSRVLFHGRQSYHESLEAGRTALEQDVWLESLGPTLERVGLSHFELMREDSAAWWCGGAARLQPNNPSPRVCLLEVMAWGTGPPDPDSAWALYDGIVGRGVALNRSSLRAYYGMAVAGVLARAGLRDSAIVVQARARLGAGGEPGRSPDAADLLGYDAAVWFRLGEPDSAFQRLEMFRQLHPDRFERAARKRMLRDFLRTDPTGAAH